MSNEHYAIEMLNITKRFPGIVANDNITLQLKPGEKPVITGFPLPERQFPVGWIDGVALVRERRRHQLGDESPQARQRNFIIIKDKSLDHL